MEENKDKLITLFERKIEILLDKNEGYARFRGMNPLKVIKELLLRELSKGDLIDLGFLLHLYALQLRLNMYKKLTPFTMLSFKKDLKEIINVLHAYQKHRNPQDKHSFELLEIPKIEELIPPLVEISTQQRSSSDNPKLYNEILDMLEENVEKIEVKIPNEIVKEMQHIDLKKIYDDLLAFIVKKRYSTVRELAGAFPVFENDKLSLVAVFNEVLFLANEGKVCLQQMGNDVGICELCNFCGNISFAFKRRQDVRRFRD